jgi:hypothetical protein
VQTALELSIAAAKAMAEQNERSTAVCALEKSGSTEYFIAPLQIVKEEFVVYAAQYPAPDNEFDE